MKVKSTQKGLILGIRFLDHSMGTHAEPIECEVFGRVISITSKHVVLEHWSVFNQDIEIAETNRERVSIVQSTILSLIEYTPKKAFKFY